MHVGGTVNLAAYLAGCMYLQHTPNSIAKRQSGQVVQVWLKASRPSKQATAPAMFPTPALFCTVEDLSTMQVCGWVWSCPKQAAVQPASEGGVAVLVNCAHGERANADTHPVWRPDLHYRIPYIRAVRTSPAGTEVLYDYRAVTFDVSEYNNLRLNPACGCGCGSRLLALANVAD